MVDVLYATTSCQVKISCNPLVIKDGLPHVVPISEQIRYHAHHLVEVLTKELNIEKGHLEDRLRARTIERIFIEERIYKKIENKTSEADVNKAIINGFNPFLAEINNIPLSEDDIERLLKIPIRRISLFDIEKNRNEITEINAKIAAVDAHLANIVDYAISYLDDLIDMADKETHKRKTEISSFESLSAKEVAVRNMDLRYDKETGYLGTNVKTGEVLMKVSSFDKVFYMKNNGEYRVANVTEKEFIGTEGLAYYNYGEKELINQEIFTVIYTEKSKLDQKKICYIKRFQIASFTTGKVYSILKNPDAKIKKFSLYPSAVIFLTYKKGKGYKQLEEKMRFADFRVQKSATGGGVRLTAKEIEKISIRPTKDNKTSEESSPDLFDEEEE